jgi:archaellin
VQSQEETMSFSKGFLDSINIDDLLKLSQKKSYFKIQSSYLSNYKSGIYAGASLSYLANSSSRIDVYSLDAGYIFDTIGKFSGSVFLNKLFYNSNSANVQSDINFSSGLSITYDAKYVNITANGNVMFGTKTDFSLSLYLDHQFSFGDEEKYLLTIDPTVTSFLGSSGYYQNYRYKIKKPNGGNSGIPQNVTITVSSPNKFQIMSYDLSLPINFDKGKWGVYFMPTYSIPVNPVTTSIKATGPNGGNIILPNQNIPRTETEQISNTFYTELGFYYRF